MGFLVGDGGRVSSFISIKRVWGVPFANNVGRANGVGHGGVVVEKIFQYDRAVESTVNDNVI